MLRPENKTASPAKGQPSNYMRDQAQRNANAAAVYTSTPPNIDLVLSRLDKVRPYGKGFTARCPAHEDRTASLSVTAGNDGRLLVHCFAGCSVHDVVGAIGLTVSDLFPLRIKDTSPEMRKELHALALKAQLKACASVLVYESTIVLIAAGDIAKGLTMADADHGRLALASERIRAARVAIGGRL